MRYPVLVPMIQLGETDKGSTAALTIHVIPSLLVAWRQTGWKNGWWWPLICNNVHMPCTHTSHISHAWLVTSILLQCSPMRSTQLNIGRVSSGQNVIERAHFPLRLCLYFEGLRDYLCTMYLHTQCRPVDWNYYEYYYFAMLTDRASTELFPAPNPCPHDHWTKKPCHADTSCHCTAQRKPRRDDNRQCMSPCPSLPKRPGSFCHLSSWSVRLWPAHLLSARTVWRQIPLCFNSCQQP